MTGISDGSRGHGHPRWACVVFGGNYGLISALSTMAVLQTKTLTDETALVFPRGSLPLGCTMDQPLSPTILIQYRREAVEPAETILLQFLGCCHVPCPAQHF
ncbi:unnamed protein product [Sphacelaria rigidula]